MSQGGRSAKAGRLAMGLLGRVELKSPSGDVLPLPAGKVEALLSYLACRPGHAHSRDHLAALFWGDVAAPRARQRLRQTLLEARRALGKAHRPALRDTGDAVLLDPVLVDVDVPAFESLAGERSPAALERAMALYRGELLQGLRVQETAFEEWLLTERERLRELAVDALGRLLAHQLAAGPPEAAIQSAIRLLGLDPAQEPVHRALMRLYVQRGRRGAALVQYQTCVALLRREFGAECEPATRALYLDVLGSQAGEGAMAGAPPRRGPADGAGGIAPAPTGSETPLVGRQVELARLSEAREAAWQGRGGLVVISGEAGIGKSRLLEAAAAEAVAAGGRLLAGSAHESEQIVAYGPWVDALRLGGGIEAIGREPDLKPGWRAELARLFPELGEVDRDAAADPTRLFGAMTELLRLLGREAPVLVTLEDFHRADPMSLHLLGYAARRLSSWTGLIVVTARNEDTASARLLDRLVEEIGARVTRIELMPLTQAETEELVRVVGAAARPPERQRLGEAVWSASRGNPFIAVETLEALQDGVLSLGGPLPIPERVRTTLAQRLAGLKPRALRMARTAAVMGRPFDFGVVQRAAGLPVHEAAEGIEELVARRLVHLTGERLDFTHHLIRQVAYEQLLPSLRETLHGAIADALEHAYRGRLDEVLDALAFHHSRARHAGRAIVSLMRVAERAVSVYAHEQAVEALREAAGHADGQEAEGRDPLLVDILLREAFSLSALGRFGEIAGRLDPLRRRVERLGDPSLAGRFFFRLALTRSYLGDQAGAVELARRAAEEAARCGDGFTGGQAHYVQALAEYYLGRPGDGIGHARRAVDLLEAAGDQLWLGLALWVQGMHSYLLGEVDAALEAAARVDGIGAASGQRRLTSFAACLRGRVHATRGEWDSGVEACRQGVDTAPDPVNTALAHGRLGHALLERGDAAEALPWLEQAAQAFERFGFPPLQAELTTLLAETRLRLGDIERARELAVLGLGLARAAPYLLVVGWAERALGRVERASGDVAAAETHLAAAVRTFDAMPCRLEAARTRLDLAELAAGRGDRPAAASHARLAAEVFAAAPAPLYLARAEALAEAPGVRPGAA